MPVLLILIFQYLTTGIFRPEMTLEEWVAWLDWSKRELVSPENFEMWLRDPRPQAGPVRFDL
jgi:hypothetical protein